MTNEIRSYRDLESLALDYGFLPFFRNDIPGFSVEEHTPPELWFADDMDGPWEWKGPVAQAGSCVYGKIFQKKAGFVSLEWFPDLANFRRDGYDFDARFDDGLASYKDKEIYDAIAESGSILTGSLKAHCGYGGKDGKKGFETIITRLQMQTYINVGAFDYMTDKYGRPYGWGVARYTTPEAQFGPDTVTAGYVRPPEESHKRMMEYLQKRLPQASEKQLLKLLAG